MTRLRLTRRAFLQTTSGGILVASFIPRTAWGANDRVSVGCIGIGGKGASDVTGVAGAGGNIVALCDVDQNRRGKKGSATEQFSGAKFYHDYREMLEKEGKRIDAVTVSTPDHTHAPASMMAMRMGKHVYCQKPMTHSIWEARQMTEMARTKGVATQMGNQAHAGEPIRRAVELIRAGMIGKVREVHAWTNRPIWPQGMTDKPAPEPVPETLDWDLWLGPAPEQPYSSEYAPFKWRGWWDFGTGALGDMGCHILDMPFWALDLKYPKTVEARQDDNTPVSGPTWSTITHTFGTGKYHDELKYVWYDGVVQDSRKAKKGSEPPKAKNTPPADVLAGAGMEPEVVVAKFDLVMIGEKGKFFFKRSSTDWVTSPASLSEEYADTPKTLPRVKDEDVEWIEACKGGPAALGNFVDYSGLLTEFVLLGNLALRTGQKLEWDGEKMKSPNCPAADQYVRREYRKGWQL
ncbi:MAG: Gfo/Idh/MocA family oxidoreductase [Thermoguttaceae bacterium]